MKKIKIKLLHPKAQIPWRGSPYSAGYDIRSIEKIIIKPKETVKIKTGIALEIPEGHYVMMAPRSSLAIKKHLIKPNSIGIIDSDYRGELFFALYNNHETELSVIEESERIAQILLLEFNPIDFEKTDSLSETERGTGSFGSTGKI